MTEPEITNDIDLWIVKLRKSLANDTPFGAAWECLRELVTTRARIRPPVHVPQPPAVR